MSRPRSPKSHAIALINDLGHRIEPTKSGNLCLAVHFYGPPDGYRWASGRWFGPRDVRRQDGEKTDDLWLRVAEQAADVAQLAVAE